MSNLLFFNNSKTNLGAPVNPGDTTITLASGAGALFSPGPTGSQYFLITLSDALTGINNEICKCTNVAGDVLTVVRAQEGTSAQSWLVGDTAQGRITAGALMTLGSEAAPTADKLTTARTIAMSADGVWSVSFDGSTSVTSALTLATVNGAPGTFGDSTHAPQIVVNAKGLVTAVTSVLINFAAAVVASAAKWTTARNLSFTGNVTGTASVDGSADVATALTIASSVNLAGSPTTTTQADADSSTKIATTAFVQNNVTDLTAAGYFPRSWVLFTVAATVVTIQKSHGITSVVRNSTGNYTVTTNQSLVAQGANVNCSTSGGSPNVQGSQPSGGVVNGANVFQFATLANSAADPDTAFIQFY